jgi:bifunctional UDP-N-acetylglucosamine pyrophosphorylase/glucosamine-1-phosphate N-acetyltransferase
MVELRVLIPAAGRGTRACLPYPKTLYPINGTPILHRLLAVLNLYDAMPTVVVSPQGEPLIHDSLQQISQEAHLVLQSEPRGMGDAVLRFEQSPAYDDAEHILLVWGDLASLQPSTVALLVDAHLSGGNDFTFATRLVDQAYTLVLRDESEKVVSVIETREQGLSPPQLGERDIGLFIFRKLPVFSMLQADLPGRLGKTTGEHGFLYVIEHLVCAGYHVSALPVATESDLISLNSLTDLQ